MLDKYKDKNEFYSLVGIKCYSYVPSLLLIIYFLITGIKLIIRGYYFNKVFRKHQMQVANCECPQHQHYKFSDAFEAIKKSFKAWWNA
ncbi:hypothetical protein [Spiroplasma endosymbiont of Tipula paludosa]|uniref:hypothetical protein n=1 Tax=Spiroplasma endosymbiont of Tipula paludosa TaxID=3066295 RepID=UPI0035C92DD5